MDERKEACSQHAFTLGGEPSLACARVDRGSEDDLLFSFSLTSEGDDQICSPSMPPGSDAVRCDPVRLAAAITWVLDLDSHAKRAFLAGSVVTKAMLATDPPPLAAPEDDSTAEEYWRIRRSSGELVRPLLLPGPSEEHLFPYQRAGVDWLLAHTVGVLADDMGLGKTLQAITAIQRLVSLGEVRNALVVCPKTLLANWETELSRWAPGLTRIRITPGAREREKAWAAVVGRVHVLITNYEQLRQPPRALRSQEIPVLIADEAHKVRNLSALVTQGMRKLQPNRFWALTGTPIERDPGDLVTLLSTMAPARFSPADSTLPTGVLRARAKPFLLRRLKDDILDQLPAVVESVETLELLPSQRRAYRAALAKGKERDDTPGALLTLINELRTICDFDPASGESIKADRITEILENVERAGEKAVVFSHLLEPLRLLMSRINTAMGLGRSLILEGSMELAVREEALSKFRRDERTFALLASSRIAAEGLTLTEANHVIFFNEWWNPSANQQARDRVVRIGQRRGVRVYKFRCKETVEESLARILHTKRETFEKIIDRLAEPYPGLEAEVLPLLQELETQMISPARPEEKET